MNVTASSPVPRQKPGHSKQDYGTPRAFLDALYGERPGFECWRWNQ